jgi:hypothetical protein
MLDHSFSQVALYLQRCTTAVHCNTWESGQARVQIDRCNWIVYQLREYEKKLLSRTSLNFNFRISEDFSLSRFLAL